MESAAIQEALDDVFDQAILFHAFTDYMRDYEIIVHAVADPNTGIPPAHLRYPFKYCVEVHATSALTPEIWRKSLDDRLVDYETGRDLDGYVWGVKWQGLYPGGQVVPHSQSALRWWQAALGMAFHEVRIETNGHDLNIIFHDLEVNGDRS